MNKELQADIDKFNHMLEYCEETSEEDQLLFFIEFGQKIIKENTRLEGRLESRDAHAVSKEKYDELMKRYKSGYLQYKSVRQKGERLANVVNEYHGDICPGDMSEECETCAELEGWG